MVSGTPKGTSQSKYEHVLCGARRETPYRAGTEAHRPKEDAYLYAAWGIAGGKDFAVRA